MDEQPVFEFKCSKCEMYHKGAPSVAYPAPAPYFGLEAAEKKTAILTDDFCEIEDDRFGLEETDASVLDCVKREVNEETGLAVDVGRLRYFSEFLDRTNNTRHLELFFDAELIDGRTSYYPNANSALYDGYILSAQWLGPTEMKGLAVFPEILKERYWGEPAQESARYLGVNIESSDRKA